MSIMLLCIKIGTACTIKCIDQTTMLQGLTVLFLHGLSSVLSVKFMRGYIFTSSALGLDDTVGNFEVSKC